MSKRYQAFLPLDDYPRVDFRTGQFPQVYCLTCDKKDGLAVTVDASTIPSPLVMAQEWVAHAQQRHGADIKNPFVHNVLSSSASECVCTCGLACDSPDDLEAHFTTIDKEVKQSTSSNTK